MRWPEWTAHKRGWTMHRLHFKKWKPEGNTTPARQRRPLEGNMWILKKTAEKGRTGFIHLSITSGGSFRVHYNESSRNIKTGNFLIISFSWKIPLCGAGKFTFLFCEVSTVQMIMTSVTLPLWQTLGIDGMSGTRETNMRFSHMTKYEEQLITATIFSVVF
jgi:hypothetical protein